MRSRLLLYLPPLQGTFSTEPRGCNEDKLRNIALWLRSADQAGGFRLVALLSQTFLLEL